MLILTRKIGQSIIIAEDIGIHILGVQGGRVKIGISAPPHVVVKREELLAGEQQHEPTEADQRT